MPSGHPLASLPPPSRIRIPSSSQTASVRGRYYRSISFETWICHFGQNTHLNGNNESKGAEERKIQCTNCHAYGIGDVIEGKRKTKMTNGTKRVCVCVREWMSRACCRLCLVEQKNDFVLCMRHWAPGLGCGALNESTYMVFRLFCFGLSGSRTQYYVYLLLISVFRSEENAFSVCSFTSATRFFFLSSLISARCDSIKQNRRRKIIRTHTHNVQWYKIKETQKLKSIHRPNRRRQVPCGFCEIYFSTSSSMLDGWCDIFNVFFAFFLCRRQQQ